MVIKNLITRKPVGYKIDKLGRKIAIYRAGIFDTNKYARKGPVERSDEAQMGKSTYKRPKV